MKLRRIEIENYGIFQDRTLDFPDAGFQVLLGANESGKSTLLNLIRELLFGFRRGTPYGFAPGSLAATAWIELANGTHLHFRRQQRRNEVTGQLEPSGQTITGTELQRMLSGANWELFQHVFGFSLAELTEGEESLKKANLDEALYGGGLGSLARFQQVQKTLEKQSDELFRPRGRNQTINRLLKQVKEAEERLRNAMLRPRDYRQRVECCEQAEQRVDQLRGKLQQLRRELDRVERLIRAMEPWQRRAAARRELTELNVPDRFPHDGPVRFDQLEQRQQHVEQGIKEHEQELADVLRRLETLNADPHLLAKAAEIEGLQQQVTRIREYRQHAAERAQQAEGKRADVRRRLQEINPAWDERQLDLLRTSLAERSRVAQLRDEQDRIEHEWDILQQQHTALDSEIRLLEGERRKLQSMRVSTTLEKLVEEVGTYRSRQQRLDELTDQLAQAAREQQQLAAQLQATLPDFDPSSPPGALPLENQLLEFRDRFRELEQAQAETSHQLRAVEEQWATNQTALEELDAKHSVPDRGALLEARRTRDADWQHIRHRYLDFGSDHEQRPRDIAENMHPLSPQRAEAAGLVDAFENAMQEADAIADQRQEHAEAVAAREQAQRQLERLEQQRQQLRRARQEGQQMQTQLHEQWHQFWHPFHLTPQSPETMQQCMQLFKAFQKACTQHQQLAERQAHVQQQQATFESQLATALNRASFEESLLAEARQAVQTARDALAQQAQLDHQLPRKIADRQQLAHRIEQKGQQRHDWTARWQSLLEQLNFPSDWSCRIVDDALDVLRTCDNQFDSAVQLEQRAADMRREIAAFDGQVRGLCQQVARDLLDPHADAVAITLRAPQPRPAHAPLAKPLKSAKSGGSAESPCVSDSETAIEAVLILARRLEAAKQAEHDKQALNNDHSKLQQRLKEQRGERERLLAERADLLRAAGVASSEPFRRIARDAQQRFELLGAIEQAERELRMLQPEAEPVDFDVQLASVQTEDLKTRRHELQVNLQHLETEFEVAVKESGNQRKEMEQLEGQGRATQLAMELESKRGELAAAVERWAPLVMAQALMQQAVERFHREHQPAVLGQVETFFRRMTAGRYVAVQRRLDDKRTLVVVEAGGEKKTASQLSTGTREQLYLAIRLAYIQHYCRDAEPLPIIMDDVLVNFDRQRAIQTLEVLRDVADHLQVLFLTCHEEMLDRIQAALGHTVEPIWLQPCDVADPPARRARRAPARAK